MYKALKFCQNLIFSVLRDNSDHHTTNYGHSNPVYNMMFEFNKISHLYQLGMSQFIFKNSKYYRISEQLKLRSLP